MNKSLYHIQTEYLELAQTLEDNGGEVTEGIEERLAINQEQLQTKGVNYALVVRQLSGESEVIDNEIKRLQALKKSKDNAVDRLKNTLKGAMELYGIQSIKGELINITLRNNTASVSIEDESKIPKKFMVPKPSVPDKKAIKEALESGIKVNGAYLQASKSILIK